MSAGAAGAEVGVGSGAGMEGDPQPAKARRPSTSRARMEERRSWRLLNPGVASLKPGDSPLRSSVAGTTTDHTDHTEPFGVVCVVGGPVPWIGAEVICRPPVAGAWTTWRP